MHAYLRFELLANEPHSRKTGTNKKVTKPQRLEHRSKVHSVPEVPNAPENIITKII